jgi:hypothetical protein
LLKNSGIIFLIFVSVVVFSEITCFAGTASLKAWGQGKIPEENNFADIAAGYNHSIALKSDGSLLAWGNNNDGQRDVPAGTNVLAIAAGYNYNVAIVYLIPGDFDANCQVNMADFSTFASRWMDTNCNYSNNWCQKVDLNKSGSVDPNDLKVFTQHWLEKYE